MKQRYLTSLVLAGVFALTSGCTTTQRTQSLGEFAQILVRRGTIETLKRRPDYRDDFVEAQAIIDAALLIEDQDVAGLRAALAQIPINELKGDEGLYLIKDIKDMVDIVLGWVGADNIDVSGLKDILRGISAGLVDGLALSPQVWIKDFYLDPTVGRIVQDGHGLADRTPIEFKGDVLPEELRSQRIFYVSLVTSNEFGISGAPGGAGIYVASPASNLMYRVVVQ